MHGLVVDKSICKVAPEQTAKQIDLLKDKIKSSFDVDVVRFTIDQGGSW